MKIITLEDHFSTALHDRLVPEDKARSAWYKDRGAHLGHDIELELSDTGARRLAAMDAAGIDVQVLSLTTPGCQAFEGEVAVRLARDANDRLFEAVRLHPDRFAGFAALPTSDPEAAVEELERAVTRLGFKGALINSHARGNFLDQRRCWPIFERAERLGVPLYLHPGGPHPGMMASYFQGFEDLSRPAWGFAVDASCHFLRILFAGVFDAYPGLKIILGHLGEGLPFGLHRLNDHTPYVARRRGLKRMPIDYLRDNLVVTTSGNFSAPAFLCTLLTLGVDNVLFSVDWPYESNKAAVDFLRTLPLSEGDREKVACRNAERLLRL